MKHSLELKPAVVMHYVEGNGGQREAAAYFNVEITSVRKWVSAHHKADSNIEIQMIQDENVSFQSVIQDNCHNFPMSFFIKAKMQFLVNPCPIIQCSVSIIRRK
ncbi:hypothetical protein AC319_22830 [Salmonella enterica subsp. arizonae]|nr:hypothetical protein [Salmonella enterica subsp. arizonae]